MWNTGSSGALGTDKYNYIIMGFCKENPACLGTTSQKKNPGLTQFQLTELKPVLMWAASYRAHASPGENKMSLKLCVGYWGSGCCLARNMLMVKWRCSRRTLDTNPTFLLA